MSNKISAQLHLLYQRKSFWYPNHLARAFARTQRSSLMRLGMHGLMRLLSKPRDIQYVLWRSQIQSQFARISQKLVAICGRTILFDG